MLKPSDQIFPEQIAKSNAIAFVFAIFQIDENAADSSVKLICSFLPSFQQGSSDSGSCSPAILPPPAAGIVGASAAGVATVIGIALADLASATEVVQAADADLDTALCQEARDHFFFQVKNARGCPTPIEVEAPHARSANEIWRGYPVDVLYGAWATDVQAVYGETLRTAGWPLVMKSVSAGGARSAASAAGLGAEGADLGEGP